MSFERTTSCGVISGTACQWPGVAAYKGIRYATAGRWEFPVPVTHWDGVYDATRYGACCYQPRAFYDEAAAPGKAFYYNEFRKGETYTYSEDCLFLNIWTPADAAPEDRLPVIFYIHGGGFTGGCGHEKHFDGPVWPTKGCVAVTINYRLGPMGFVCLPELADEAGSTGNYAFLDQLAALQWVRDNIAAFGGDANNITIMGQSAGAMSVQQLVLSPITRGLFSKAVMSSGGGVSQMLTAKPAEAHYPFWKQVMETAGCSTLAEFRALAPAQLFPAWDAVRTQPKFKGMGCEPVVDGRFQVKTGPETLAADEQHHIPYLIGFTSEDIVPPYLYQMAQDWCARNADSYGWFFDRQLPGDDRGAWHSSDLWYWFGTLAHCWRPFTEKDTALSAQMVDYLTNFARTGDPTAQTCPSGRLLPPSRPIFSVWVMSPPTWAAWMSRSSSGQCRTSPPWGNKPPPESPQTPEKTISPTADVPKHALQRGIFPYLSYAPWAFTLRGGLTRRNFNARSGVVSGQSSSKVMGIFLACSSSASSSFVKASSFCISADNLFTFTIIEPPLKIRCQSC